MLSPSPRLSTRKSPRSREARYLGVTFQPNKSCGIHRWYPYIEGFAGEFVARTLAEFGVTDGAVFDPFGGCGTTAVETSIRGLESVSTDVNPFMCFVARAKTRKYSRTSLRRVEARLRREIRSYSPDQAPDNLSDVFADKDYFSEDNLAKIRFLKHGVKRIRNGATRDFFTLALAAILVKVSRLKRAPDLKYKAKDAESPDAFECFLEAVDRMQLDIDEAEEAEYGEAKVLCDNITSPDRLGTEYDGLFDIAITSPPYLNGTNYFRNTKLELWVFDYLGSPRDLRELREAAITAGINAVQMRGGSGCEFDEVREVVDKLAASAYDPRIPVMAASYFRDMRLALGQIWRVLKPDCRCVLVIGDSYFADTHIPTDTLLSRIADSVGFVTEENRIVRSRKSRGGFPLHESVLVLGKQTNGRSVS